jgi:hypothetical protein
MVIIKVFGQLIIDNIGRLVIAFLVHFDSINSINEGKF